MDIVIDREGSVPLYLQIVRQVRDAIRAGTLPAGHLLPPERRLADELGLNRSTVLSAYRELKRLGLVEAHVGRGTTVVGRELPGADAVGVSALRWRHLFGKESAASEDPLVRDLLELTDRKDVIPLAIGLPAPELLPLEIVRGLLDGLVCELGPASLLHSPTEGLPSLREALADWLQAERGIAAAAGEVLVLSGSQQGLSIATSVFFDPGDVVVVEEPSYFGALQSFRAAGLRLVGVPTDERGMRTDLLEEVLTRVRPKLIYTLPTFQNPSGAVMSLERRRHLLQLAHEHQVPILEDDPYGDLRYDGEALPSLKALDEHGLVLYLGTVSKVLFPGLRLGWLVAPEPVVRRFALVKQTVDLHSSTPGQALVERLLRGGHYRDHLERVRPTYARRRDLMHGLLSAGAPEQTSWRRPEGGFYIWLTLPPGIERNRLLARAAEAGVAFLPGWACYPEDPEATSLRLNFSFPTDAQIRAGVTRLLEVVDGLPRRSRSLRTVEVGTPPIV